MTGNVAPDVGKGREEEFHERRYGDGSCGWHAMARKISPIRRWTGAARQATKHYVEQHGNKDASGRRGNVAYVDGEGVRTNGGRSPAGGSLGVVPLLRAGDCSAGAH